MGGGAGVDAEHEVAAWLELLEGLADYDQSCTMLPTREESTESSPPARVGA